MKILRNVLKNELNIRTEKNFPIEGIEFIDITPLIIQSNSFEEIINNFVNELQDKNIDYIVAPEARGFLLGAVLADRLKVGCIPVRKKGKLPPTTVAATFEYEKEYGKDYLELPKLVNTTYNGKNFYIIDDIYGTGHTMNSIANAITNLGGNIVGKGVIMNIVELNSDKDVFSLLDIEES